MLKILSVAIRPQLLSVCKRPKSLRTFLSQAYYCNEIWEDRLNSPIFQKVNLDVLYHELDEVFKQTRRISAVDVDIFANSVKDGKFVDEMLDLVHKLRVTEDTGKTLNSTSHAVIRSLMKHERIKELVQAVDDRLNYGLFLDDYTGIILMDKFWKSKDFVAGSIIASQFMLQEEFNHPAVINFALLHCYNYLLNPGEWPEVPKPEEPEEVVKVRVRFLRNPFDDEHFDLRDPKKIVGKTLAAATSKRTDSLHKSLKIIGLTLFGKEELAKKEFEDCIKNNIKLVKEIVNLLPDETPLKQALNQSELISEDVESLLQKQVTESVSMASEKDVASQCEAYKQWESERMEALEEQKKRLLTGKRLAEVERLQQSLKEKEQKLWFFENEEKIELAIEEGAAILTRKSKKEKNPAAKEYVPPEVTAKPV